MSMYFDDDGAPRPALEFLLNEFECACDDVVGSLSVGLLEGWDSAYEPHILVTIVNEFLERYRGISGAAA